MQQIVVITGAAGGIGRQLCKQLIENDPNQLIQIIAFDRDVKGLHELTRQLGPRVHGVPVDLTDTTALGNLIEDIRARFGRIDTLINNAAVVMTGPFAERDPALIEFEIRINLIAPLVLTRLSVPLLQQSSRPHVINTVSVAGVFPTPESAIYSASKFGLRGAMLSIALDLKNHGILVSNVMPSATDTDMLRQEAISGGNVLQFMDPPQLPEDVAGLICRVMKNPKMESAPRPSELWLTKLAMLFPNQLPMLLPLFKRQGERGLKRYLNQLETRGLIEREGMGWRLREQGDV